jgi:hypothetical protein
MTHWQRAREITSNYGAYRVNKLQHIASKKMTRFVSDLMFVNCALSEATLACYWTGFYLALDHGFRRRYFQPTRF